MTNSCIEDRLDERRMTADSIAVNVLNVENAEGPITGAEEHNDNSVRDLEELIGKDGSVVEVDIQDGRIDTCGQGTYLGVDLVEEDPTLIRVRLRTDHYAFSIKKSCVTRTLGSFYQLQSTLKANHPYVQVPSLPLRPSMWLGSYKYRSEQLAVFLSMALKEIQLLSDKALHLFLQTNLSMDRIKKNMDGLLDDEVMRDKRKLMPDNRTNSKEGFQGLFGKNSML